MANQSSNRIREGLVIADLCVGTVGSGATAACSRSPDRRPLTASYNSLFSREFAVPHFRRAGLITHHTPRYRRRVVFIPIS